MLIINSTISNKTGENFRKKYASGRGNWSGRRVGFFVVIAISLVKQFIDALNCKVIYPIKVEVLSNLAEEESPFMLLLHSVTSNSELSSRSTKEQYKNKNICCCYSIKRMKRSQTVLPCFSR